MLPVRTVSHQSTEEEVKEAVVVVVVIIGTGGQGEEEASPFSISVQQKRTTRRMPVPIQVSGGMVVLLSNPWIWQANDIPEDGKYFNDSKEEEKQQRQKRKKVSFNSGISRETKQRSGWM